MTKDEYKEYYKKTIEPCWENELNKELKKEYENLKLSVENEIKEKLSCPLLIFPGPNYNIGEGIFIIGRETHGWGHKDVGFDFLSFENPPVGIDKEKTLMQAQADWFMCNYQYYIDSDFHNAVKAITGVATGEGFLKSPFVWDDLIAVDYEGGSYKSLIKEDRKKVISYSKQKLEKEFTLAKPKLAVFFIGSYADDKDCFWRIFDATKMSKMDEVCPNLNHFVFSLDDHSIECYATYHPSYKGWVNKKEVLRTLAEIVREAQK